MKKLGLGRRIKDLMEAKKIGENDLARSLGLPRIIIRLYLKGVLRLEIYDLELIAFKLNARLEELLGGSKVNYLYTLRRRKFLTDIFLILVILVLWIFRN